MMLNIVMFMIYFTTNLAFLTPMNKIYMLRRGVDTIDNKISFLIDTRMEMSKKIGKLKKEHEIEDPIREEQIKSKIKKNHPRLPPALIDDLWTTIFAFSKEAQRNG